MTHDKSFTRGRTRHQTIKPDEFDQSQPRIGRRESEPHSFEISYLHDVLTSNFEKHHTLWDLHHYFRVEGEEIDIQYDISFFLNFTLPYTLSSYRASEYGHRIPDLAINILSKSTWKTDLSENLDISRILKIPCYIVFCKLLCNNSWISNIYYRIDFNYCCVSNHSEKSKIINAELGIFFFLYLFLILKSNTNI